jgi:hypothetical protein
VDKVSDVLSLTEVTYLKKGFGLPKGVGEEQRGDLHVSLDPQWENTPPTVWEHFLQVRPWVVHVHVGCVYLV